MSSTTLKLPYKRFVAQVSTGAPRSKSTYLALMAENLAALQACPWRAAETGTASLTGHDFTAETQFSDAYDAFKLTGNYDSSAMTEIAYAGMAAYRFTIPASATSGGVRVTSVTLPISRDRFEKSGVHLSVALSASSTPTPTWDFVRGSGDRAASSQLAQTTAEDIMSGAPDDGTVTIDLTGVSSGNPNTYLWVYVTLEDYTDHWTMYNAREKRLYAIEGSAMLAGDRVEVTFADTVTPDASATIDPDQQIGLAYMDVVNFSNDPDAKIAFQNYSWTLSAQEQSVSTGITGMYMWAITAFREAMFSVARCGNVAVRDFSDPPYDSTPCKAQLSIDFRDPLGDNGAVLSVSYVAVPVAFRFLVPKLMKGRPLELFSGSMIQIASSPVHINTNHFMAIPKVHVWCADGQALDVVPESVVRDRRFSYPSLGSPADWCYCGNMLAHTTGGSSGWNGHVDHMKIPTVLSRDVATIILMPVIEVSNLEGSGDLCAFNPSTDWIRTQNDGTTLKTFSAYVKFGYGPGNISPNFQDPGLVLSTC